MYLLGPRVLSFYPLLVDMHHAAILAEECLLCICGTRLDLDLIVTCFDAAHDALTFLYPVK